MTVAWDILLQAKAPKLANKSPGEIRPYTNDLSTVKFEILKLCYVAKNHQISQILLDRGLLSSKLNRDYIGQIISSVRTRAGIPPINYSTYAIKLLEEGWSYQKILKETAISKQILSKASQKVNKRIKGKIDES